MTKILVATEKHGTRFFDISTPELWANACLTLLSDRFKEGWYHRPEPIVPQPLPERPEGLSDRVWEQAELEHRNARAACRRDTIERDWYDQAEDVVQRWDTSMVKLGKLGTRMEREEPLAWILLRDRSGGQYERVEVEEAVQAEGVSEL